VDTMLAAVYHGPNDLRVERRQIPWASAGELLVRIDSAGICATDVRILNGSHRKVETGSLRIPGHEIVGTVVEVGAGVSICRPGQQVFVAPNVGCGRCRRCLEGDNNLCARSDAFGITLDGGFAEYMRITAPAVTQGNVIPVPAHVDREAMSLVEPFACVLRGQEAVGVGPGDVVVIQGAGPIGLMHLLQARHRGARRILVSALTSSRLEKARELGADRVVNIGQEDLEVAVAEETAGEGADVVIVAAGVHAAQEQALRLAGTRGRINYFGGLPKERPEIRFDSNMVHYKELIVTGTTACSTADCRKAAELVSAGQIDLRPLVGARFFLSDARAAFEAVRAGSALKVVLLPGVQEEI